MQEIASMERPGTDGDVADATIPTESLRIEPDAFSDMANDASMGITAGRTCRTRFRRPPSDPLPMTGATPGPEPLRGGTQRSMKRISDDGDPRGPAPGATDSIQGISAEALLSLRADMLRFAELQLRDRDTAEDLVQESIEAALRKSSSFAGQSTLKTWVFAILRNRMIDHLRQASRTVNLSSLVADEDDWQEQLESMFNERGAWRDGPRPVAWPDPQESMQTRQFWAVFETCLDHLPPRIGRVFMMREFLGFESEEICRQLRITTSNCHVILHRARLKLRSCMDTGWGRPEGASC